MMHTPLTLLFLASNPTHTARLQVDKECRAIDHALLKARDRRAVRLRWFSLAAASLVLLAIILALISQMNRPIYQPLDMNDYWVEIPAGTFQMGSQMGEDDEKPVHPVTLDAFEIGRYEVTNRQYAQCVRAGVCFGPVIPSYILPEYERHPVTNANWSHADTFCRWVGGRLPTEAEWEKAARGGLQGKLYPWGDADPVCTPGVENGAQFYECKPQGTTAVGSFKPNEYGLFDMDGNVSEWVSDWYGPSYYQSSPNQNPTGPQSGTNRVVRGGSWFGHSDYLRVAHRGWNPPDIHGIALGFRCARSQ